MYDLFNPYFMAEESEFWKEMGLGDDDDDDDDCPFC